MKRSIAALAFGLSALVAGSATAQNPPQTSTKKVDGTENVYIFRYGGHQSIFIVTPQGVIVTDPISNLLSPSGQTLYRCHQGRYRQADQVRYL
jgi:hypothetical protein